MRLLADTTQITIAGESYPVFVSFVEGQTRWFVIHQLDQYLIAEETSGKPPQFVRAITAPVLQILQGLPSPEQSLTMPLWLVSARYSAMQACRFDAPVRAVFGSYIALLGQLSRLTGETQESQILRGCLDLLWPSLTENEVQQANNLRSILWFSPKK